jgi:hypothetical protein
MKAADLRPPGLSACQWLAKSSPESRRRACGQLFVQEIFSLWTWSSKPGRVSWVRCRLKLGEVGEAHHNLSRLVAGPIGHMPRIVSRLASKCANMIMCSLLAPITPLVCHLVKSGDELQGALGSFRGCPFVFLAWPPVLGLVSS